MEEVLPCVPRSKIVKTFLGRDDVIWINFDYKVFVSLFVYVSDMIVRIRHAR